MITNGFEYDEILINDQVKRNQFYDDNNFKGSERSVPKIWNITDGEYIGGYTELSRKYSQEQ